MEKKHTYLAFDLGAESGRALLGVLSDDRLVVEELTRFPNKIIERDGHIHWDMPFLFGKIKDALKKAAAGNERPESLAVDTWGVDFCLFDDKGEILDLPFAYRDKRNEGAAEEFYSIISKEDVYRKTGIQEMPFNTLFQLYSMVRDRSPLLEKAKGLLFMPDAFHYLLSGEKKNEFTISTTSMMLNPTSGCWDKDLLQALELKDSFFQEMLRPGSVYGMLKDGIAEEAGIEPVPVVATACHDTASAVASMPTFCGGSAYISCGTWSLVGVETVVPILSDRAMELDFTNEGGVGGTYRFLKNVMGLWLLQSCRKVWASDREYSYGELVEMARGVDPFAAFLDPDWQGFLNPPDMVVAIDDFCRLTDQQAPRDPATITRVILESLALKYRVVLDQLSEILEEDFQTVHILGGGGRNDLLCFFTANATGMEVVVGPFEATAIGNILVQAMAMGVVGNLFEMRQIVRSSFSLESVHPVDTSPWEDALERFKEISMKARNES